MLVGVDSMADREVLHAGRTAHRCQAVNDRWVASELRACSTPIANRPRQLSVTVTSSSLALPGPYAPATRRDLVLFKVWAPEDHRRDRTNGVQRGLRVVLQR